jgi:hypothetical protein
MPCGNFGHVPSPTRSASNRNSKGADAGRQADKIIARAKGTVTNSSARGAARRNILAGANAGGRTEAARHRVSAGPGRAVRGPGHYETWAQWPRDRTVDPALRALVRSHEYEDWPRGIVFDRLRDLFILYADRKLLAPAMSARIATQFHLPTERTEVQSDFHYQSTETPNVLGS